MKFILFKLNPKHHQILKLKLNNNHIKNKKNFRKNKKIKRIKLEYFIIN
jgi:hypothetical protein